MSPQVGRCVDRSPPFPPSCFLSPRNKVQMFSENLVVLRGKAVLCGRDVIFPEKSRELYQVFYTLAPLVSRLEKEYFPLLVLEAPKSCKDVSGSQVRYFTQLQCAAQDHKEAMAFFQSVSRTGSH
jgi:hypothetical protein